MNWMCCPWRRCVELSITLKNNNEDVYMCMRASNCEDTHEHTYEHPDCDPKNQMCYLKEEFISKFEFLRLARLKTSPFSIIFEKRDRPRLFELLNTFRPRAETKKISIEFQYFIFFQILTFFFQILTFFFRFQQNSTDLELFSTLEPFLSSSTQEHERQQSRL